MQLLCISLFFVSAVKCSYEVPEVRIEALSPKGLRVSIPDEEGISLFAFHGKINEEMDGREAGQFSVDVLRSKDGRWTYINKSARLKVGDVIYYWVNVDYDDGNGMRGYVKDADPFAVIELIPDGSPVTTKKPVALTTAPTTTDRSFCTRSPTKVKGKYSCKGKLIFNDLFMNLNHEKWKPEVKFAGDPDYEFVIYKNEQENLLVENQILHIRPMLTEKKYGLEFVYNSTGLDLGVECTGILQSTDCVQSSRAWQILPPTISARISTVDSFSFVYGTIEIKAKLPKGDWVYPEISLIPKSNYYGPGYDSGRLRIAFVPGNNDLSNYLYAGCNLGDSMAARNYGMKKLYSKQLWTDDYHVFKLEWKPDGIAVSVDNQLFGTVYPVDGGFAADQVALEVDSKTATRWKQGSLLAPFDQEMYITLGVGVGGRCFGDVIGFNKPWENDDPKGQLRFYRNQNTWSKTWSLETQLLVDYVKVWAL
ncbi:hypothetical protein FQA39_LY11620 [Lamprigera yunnana]|nr:hypothetical protein FQA39_LY11620 [Lamprigera yunnana]